MRCWGHFGFAFGAVILPSIVVQAESTAGGASGREWFSPWTLIVSVFVLAVIGVMWLLRREVRRQQASSAEGRGVESDEAIGGHLRP
jgi:hypothetical protein